MITFGEVCAGVGGMSRGLIAAGMTPRWFVEWDKSAAGVLALHHPGIPIHADLNQFYPNLDEHSVGLIAGGTSCQNLSVAGNGKGLDGEQSRVFYQMVRVCKRLQPRFIQWENVPGALSSNGGKDFAAILCAFTGTPVGIPEDGWGSAGFVPSAFPSRWNVAWRVLDSQYFGVPQRRRRVFLVGSIGDSSCCEILFNPESVRGDNPPSRSEGQRVAPTIEARAGAGGGGWGTDFMTGGGLAVAPTITSKWSKGTGGPSGDECQNLVATHYAIQAGALKENPNHGPDGVGVQTDVAYTLEARAEVQCVATAFKASHYTRDKDGAPSEIAPPLSADADKGDQDTLVAFSCKDHGADAGELSPTLRAMGHAGSHANAGGQVAVAIFNDTKTISAEADTAETLRSLRHEAWESAGHKAESAPAGCGVRRLTPIEVERLQSWPDGWTAERMEVNREGNLWIPTGKIVPQADGPRYKQAGNGVTSNASEWIARRIIKFL